MACVVDGETLIVASSSKMPEHCGEQGKAVARQWRVVLAAIEGSAGKGSDHGAIESTASSAFPVRKKDRVSSSKGKGNRVK